MCNVFYCKSLSVDFLCRMFKKSLFIPVDTVILRTHLVQYLSRILNWNSLKCVIVTENDRLVDHLTNSLAQP